MTKEELKKEAEEKYNERLKQNGIKVEYRNETYTDGYLDGAEPREKRIEELKKENAELTQENEEMKKGLGCETCQIHLEYMRLNNKIADFEKESTELKAGRDINVFTKQLTNAKEIISEYINILKGDTKNWKKTQEKAEQFLNSEVEK